MDRLATRFARWSHWLPLLTLVPVLWHISLLARIFASRLTYPMDAEWMEGGELYHAYRWLHGQTVYGPPAQGFTPYGYPPFHFLVLALAGTVFQLDYGAGRAISILCFVAACAVLFRESWRQLEGGPRAVALGALAVGLAAAGFPVIGGWYDFVRNDTLAVALPVVAAGLVSDVRLTHRRTLLVAALLVASVYTKQTDIFFAAWLCFYVLIREWRRGLALAGLAALGGGLTFAIAQLVTHGWFWKWVTLMSKHKLNLTRLTTGPMAVLGFAPFLYAIPALFAVLVIKRWLSARGALWAGMLLASIPVSILPHIKAGGFLNNLMPVVFLAGGTALILCGDLVNGLRRSGAERGAWIALSLVLAGASALLIVKRYDAAPFVVSAERRQKAVALNELVRGLEGGVFIPDHPFLAARNGITTPQAHSMAQWDAYSAGLTGDIFSVLALSQARWLLWGSIGAGIPRPLGKYVYDRRVDVALPSMIGHAGTPNALFRRAP
jgi:hypothetical protein